MQRVFNGKAKLELAKQFGYWDEPVLKLKSDYYFNEIVLIHELDENYVVRYMFNECYEVRFYHAREHIKKLEKHKFPPKNYSYAQIDYFLFDIAIEEQGEGEAGLYYCRMDLGIATLEILCYDIEIQKLSKEEVLPDL